MYECAKKNYKYFYFVVQKKLCIVYGLEML